MGKGAIVEHIVNWTLLITLILALILIIMDEFPVAIQYLKEVRRNETK